MITSIIEQRFEEWTAGVGPGERHIRIFEQIRDIPFAVILEFFDLEESPAGMLEKNKGFCVPKHLLLGTMYEKLNIPVKYCAYSFRWKQQDVVYPVELMELAENIPVTYHLACKALLDGSWVCIDATWDPVLEKAGFPVNEKWDGKSDTRLAVKPIEEFTCGNIRKTREMLAAKFAAYSLPEKLELSRFSMELNKWLDELRAHNIA